VRLAFSRAAPGRLDRELREEARTLVGRALEFFEQSFGAYPLDELTVVTLPRRFSQSYPGFITLTDAILAGRDPFTSGGVDFVRRTLVAHEIAHQWWGNLVGWASYRDQWLSEAMANYAALLWVSRQQGQDSTLLAELAAGWREMLARPGPDGRTLESLGPVVLGSRLNSSRSATAYRAIVYRKGAVVLAMLARAVGEEPFLRILREIAASSAGRSLATEDFLAAVERASGLELDGFAHQFIYGTGIPHVYYRYEPGEPTERGWRLRGVARLLAEPSFSFEVVRTASGWDVRRSARPGVGHGAPALMVPFRVTHDDPTGSDPAAPRRVVRSRWGRLMLAGPVLAFEVETEERPVGLELDPRGELFARFYSFATDPKRSLRLQAQDLALEGDLEGAERAYLEALGRELGPAGTWLRGAARARRIEDARIRLGLARLCLDQGRGDEAAAQLSALDELLGDERELFRVERDALRGRLDVQRGHYAAAYARLKKTLHVLEPRRGPQSWRARLEQLQLTSERLALTEAYALLAVAARETGNVEDFAWAAAEARQRGASLPAP
jgi:hypothetical protein